MIFDSRKNWPRRLRQIIIQCALLAACLPSQASRATLYAAPAAVKHVAQQPAEIRRLQLDQPVRRAGVIPGAENYLLDLQQGQHLRLTVDCLGLTCGVALFEQKSQRGLTSEVAFILPSHGELSYSAEQTATYLVRVSLRGKRGRAGQYELRATVLTNPDELFHARARVQALHEEVWRLYPLGTKETNQQTVEQGQAALALLPKLGRHFFEWELNWLVGDTYRSLGDYQQALHHLKQALQAARALNLFFQQAETLTTIGQVYNGLGDYPAALAAYQQALPLWEQDDNYDKPVNLIGWTLASLGSAYSVMGEPAQAIEHYQQSAARYRECCSLGGLEFHRGMVMVNNGLGAVYAKLGDKQQALDHFNAMLEHIRQTDWWYGEAQALGSLANLYVSLGEYPPALEKYEAALAITRKAGERPNEAAVLNSLGNFYRLTGDFSRAQTHLQQALVIYRAVQAKRGEAVALTNLAALAGAQGQAQQALRYSTEALKLWQEIGDRYGAGVALNEMGMAHAARANFGQAHAHFTRALELRRSTGDREGEAGTRHRLAQLARAAGQLTAAQTHIEAALKLTESVRSSVLSQELRASYTGTTRDYYEFYIDLLMQQHWQNPAAAFAAQALQASEAARARLLLDTLAEARADIRQGARPAAIARERELQQRLSAKADYQFRLHSKPHAPAQRAALDKELQTLAEELQAVQARIRATSPRYAALTQARPLTAPAIQQLLDRQTLLLEYALGAERSYLWAVTPTTLRAYELPPRAAIEKLARRGYELLTARNRARADETPARQRASVLQADREWHAVAKQLSQMILGPVAAELDHQRLLIVAQGALQYIPFGALPLLETGRRGDAETGRRAATRPRAPSSRRLVAPRPLIAAHEITMLPSASTLAFLRRSEPGTTSATPRIAILADPVFTADDERVQSAQVARPATAKDPPAKQTSAARIALHRALREVDLSEDNLTARFSRLYATRREAEAISALLPAQRQLRALDFAANRATATSPQLAQYDILHFATHALINSTHPELSGILLSLVDEQGQPQDGFLRAHEIYNLKLPAQLVVLSACQTGLGKEVKGEGIIGLTQSFMYAGAARVAVSLWALNDSATADLMTRFYQHLLGAQRRSPAAALRAAQVEMWQSGRWPAPYFWAGFVLQGEWR